jgi:hypothetical protein
MRISLLKYEEHAYCFFQHYQGCAYIFVPQEQTANKHYCIDTCLWENVQQKQPEKWNFTMSVNEFWATNEVTLVSYPLLTRFSTVCLISFQKTSDGI